MTRFSHLHTPLRLCIATLIASLASAAQAYTLDLVQANGNTVDSSFSSADMLSLDIGLSNTLPITLQLTPDVGGDLPQLAFNAIVRNYLGLGLAWLQIDLSGGSFQALGSVGGTFAAVADVEGDSSQARIRFSSPEYVEATLGDWFLDGSQQDFVLDIAQASAAQPLRMTISAAVPEPGSWALLLAGVALLPAALSRTPRTRRG